MEKKLHQNDWMAIQAGVNKERVCCLLWHIDDVDISRPWYLISRLIQSIVVLSHKITIIDLFSLGSRWIHNSASRWAISLTLNYPHPHFIWMKTIEKREKKSVNVLYCLFVFGKIRWVFCWKQWPFEILSVLLRKLFRIYTMNGRLDVHNLHSVSLHLGVSLVLSLHQHFSKNRTARLYWNWWLWKLIWMWWIQRFSIFIRFLLKIEAEQVGIHLHRSIFD